MALSSRFEKVNIILIIIIAVMSLEIVYLMYQNQKLKAIIEDPKRLFKTLSEDDVVPSFNGFDVYDNEIAVRYGPDAPHTLLCWFSPGCSSCLDNLAFWNDLFERFSSENIRFIGMCAGHPDETREFVAEHGIGFPVLCADDPFFVDTYKGNVLPQTVLLSPNGTIVGVWPGALKKDREKTITDLLAEL